MDFSAAVEISPLTFLAVSAQKKKNPWGLEWRPGWKWVVNGRLHKHKPLTILEHIKSVDNCYAWEYEKAHIMHGEQ